VDQLVSGAGTAFRAGSQISLERAINRFLDRGPELQRAAAVRASQVRTMDEHFTELFARYQGLVPRHVIESDTRREIAVGDVAPAAALGS
jgi:hypothetical protein